MCVCVSRPEQSGRGAGNSSEECNAQHSLQQVSEQEQQIHAVQSESIPLSPLSFFPLRIMHVSILHSTVLLFLGLGTGIKATLNMTCK